jgi:anti-sigma factor ChrR (cupin superfamily)
LDLGAELLPPSDRLAGRSRYFEATAPTGNVVSWQTSTYQAAMLEVLEGSIVMDAATPKGAQTADTHSHLVRPHEMEWQKTRFPGCEAKTLLFDRATGLMTALMRFAPGAVLPDHEHVNIEQTYVLEGHLVDKEGPAKGIEARAGEFIWR